MGKSRVVPVKPATIPGLELSAAVMSVKIGSMLQQELDYEKVSQVYWSDSKVVLGYISNEARRFRVYVANRVQQIKEHTHTAQWHHVASSENPADIASTGLNADEFVNSTTWLNGPEFLWKESIPQSKPENFSDMVNPEDPELKVVKSFSCKMERFRAYSLLERLEFFSSWDRAKLAVALCLRYKAKLRQKISEGSQKKSIQSCGLEPLTVDELFKAECEIVKHTQSQSFKSEIKILRDREVIGVPVDKRQSANRHKNLKSKSDLYRLDPFLDTYGILHVGGRIQNAEIPDRIKYPFVLPKKGHVTNLIARHFYDKTLHQGCGMPVNEIRNSGFWIKGASSVVSSLIAKCVVCRKLRGTTQGQQMSNLPSDCLEPAPPFTYCAVDLFGPFLLRQAARK